jgi:hypothetical protein
MKFRAAGDSRGVFLLLPHCVGIGFGLFDARPDMDADNLLARVFGALKAFIAQLHASLILSARPIGAMTFDTSSVLRQFALHCGMNEDGWHNKLLCLWGTQNSRRPE